ncbi:MAG TPA: PAS domain S-box protein [Candidatus Saccharimonadia bacterium]|jgi:PAS domain S-box-containing protein
MRTEELHALIDACADAVIVRDTEGRIAYWNKGAEAIYGFTSEQAIGKIAHDLLKTQFTTPLPEVLKQVTQLGHWTGELQHTRKDGKEVYVLSRWSRRSVQSELPDILEVNTNISARKMYERKMQEINRVMLGNEREILKLRARLAENGISQS